MDFKSLTNLHTSTGSKTYPGPFIVAEVSQRGVSSQLFCERINWNADKI